MPSRERTSRVLYINELSAVSIICISTTMVFISSNPAQPAATEGSTGRRESSCVGIDAISAAVSSPHKIVLPPVASDDFVSQRHEVNPALALNLLSDVQAKIGVWQQQQRQIVHAMQMLYSQGPMVDGWLQSSLEPSTSSVVAESATLLRHGDADALMQYVNALESGEDSSRNSRSMHQSAGSTLSSRQSQYCLCRLNDDGTVRSHICPPEQMAMVSTAIARHQKFKQLALQKQAIAAKLQQAVDLLTGLRATLQQS